MLNRCSRTLALIAASLSSMVPSMGAIANQESVDPIPRSIILLIGDGFDDQHVTMGRNFLAGHGGQLIVDTLPMRGALQIETIDPDGTPLYTADSANTATSIASGVVTNIGRIGTDQHDEDTPTIVEVAANAGLRTGIVSTASVTGATPAAFIAHVANRNCENPEIVLGGQLYGQTYEGCPQDSRRNGGPGSIAEQIAGSVADIVLGGGLKHFVKPDPDTGNTALELSAEKGFTVATDLEQLLAANTEQRLLGLFADSHLPVRMRGTDDRKAESPTTSLLNAVDYRLGSVTQPEPMTCERNPDFNETPSLAQMTEIAIDRLSDNNEKGFFLMVESASIDKQSHRRNPCGSIGEIEQLEEALAIALNYAETHPNTLIIVTADHAQAAQIVPEPSLYDAIPIPIYSPGKIARIKTPEGGMMRINYATNNFVAEEHTGANVPLFALAPAGITIPAFLRQRDLHALMIHYLQLD